MTQTCDTAECNNPATHVRTLFGRDFPTCDTCAAQLDASAKRSANKRRADRSRSYSGAVGQYSRRG